MAAWQAEKLEDGTENVEVTGNIRSWWNELTKFFLKDERSVWYMEETSVVIEKGVGREWDHAVQELGGGIAMVLRGG